LSIDAPATLLQVGHHGSLTSSGTSFLRRVRPRYAVISSARRDAGTNRRYCHPRAGTVSRLTRVLGGAQRGHQLEAFAGRSCRKQRPGDWQRIPTSARLFATARDGDVTLRTHGDGVFTRVVPQP